MEGMAVKLSKNVRYLVRVRDYETIHVEVGAEASHYDLGIDDQHLASLDGAQIDRKWDSLQRMVEIEVDRLAREELTIIAGWSEISPNLAEDYLSVEPPTTVQRNQHANNKKTGARSASTGGERRRAATTTTPRSA
jgi:hypothetical protein